MSLTFWFFYILHGVKGIVKAILGVDKAQRHIVQTRRRICSKCPDNNDGWCWFCGCNLRFKTKLAHEVCDANRWPYSLATKEEAKRFEPDYNNLTDVEKRHIKEEIQKEFDRNE